MSDRNLTFVIADLHGRHDLLSLAIDRIHRYIATYGGGSATLVTLGDYIDRGPASSDVIATLMALSTDNPRGRVRTICLRGNHEEIMSIAARDPSKVNWWLRNGGGQTLISYGQKDGERADPTVIPRAHLDWIATLPLLHFDARRIFIHAGVDDGPLDDQSPHRLTWKIYGPGEAAGGGNRHVVHGHHQHQDGPLVLDGRTNLDTFAWFTGRLVVGVFDDEIDGGPVDTIEVRGPSADELLNIRTIWTG